MVSGSKFAEGLDAPTLPDFRLRHFGIVQSNTAMKVGTDGILLGAWVANLPIAQPHKILDVGTGTGILSLMMAQRYPEANILAIDIEAGAIDDATTNVRRSPYAERISVELLPFERLTEQGGYDLIISNPPYFEASGLGSPDSSRLRARREDRESLSLESLIAKSRTLLSPHGYLALVAPSQRLDEIRHWATLNLLTLEHLCWVYSKPEQLIRVLVCLRPLLMEDTYQQCKQSTLTLRMTEGGYTPEYQKLTENYLLSSTL